MWTLVPNDLGMTLFMPLLLKSKIASPQAFLDAKKTYISVTFNACFYYEMIISTLNAYPAWILISAGEVHPATLQQAVFLFSIHLTPCF